MKKIVLLLLGTFLTTVSIAQTYQNTTIYTPMGTPITALLLISGELTAQQKLEAKNYWLSYYNNRITFISEATRIYNCHAYAWYMTEGGSTVWINTPGDDAFWNDNSFISSTPSLGTKVFFASDDHSAITTNQQGILESKWGPSPVFRHTIDDCPYDHSVLNYYIKNCNVNFTNQTVTTDTTVTSCGNINVQNVKVQNGAKLTLDAVGEVNIISDFEVELGSEFEIK
jgi:hypothetical protein